MKSWYPHTKKIKYCSSAKFDEHNNKFGKGCSPGFELMLGKNILTFPKLQIDLSYSPFIKDDIFEVKVNFPTRETCIGIVSQYCEHHNMSYISQSANNIPRNHSFPAINRTNVWMISIGRKESKTFQQVLETISIQ